MSISQLFQPNQYTLYGNFQASASGTVEDELVLQYATTNLDPTYAFNKVSYSVFGKCVSFQAIIKLSTKGAGNGEVSITLPDSMPQAYVDVDNPQICQLVCVPAGPDGYKDWWGEFDIDRKIYLWRRDDVEDGPIDILDATEVAPTTMIKLAGVYFTE